MKILLTGAFGNIGYNIIIRLIESGHEVIAFDLPTKNNLKKFKKMMRILKSHGMNKNLQTIWGDILTCKELDNILLSVNIVIHLAAIIPNLSEIKKDLATRVNVRGTERLLIGLKRSSLQPKIIFASTVTVLGPTMHLEPPVSAELPYNPTNHYASTKVEAEKLILASGLNYVILRFTASLDPDFSGMLNIENLSNYYEIPVKQRFEFLDARDAALALMNATNSNINRRIFLIGGGSRCQFIYSEFIDQLFYALGIGKLPHDLFKIPTNDQEWYTVNWLDTKDAQEALEFQQHSFTDFLSDMKIKMRSLRYLIFLFNPLVKYIIIRSSPYRLKSQ